MRKNAQKPKVIAVVGATSTGKTAFAIALAARLGGEVVSVDSRQVYRGLNLGTGKATKKEMAGVPHHLLDVASPSRAYSAARFARDARKAIDGILKRGRVPILCGGTGFYLDMVLGRISSPDVPPNSTLRARLKRKSASELFAALQKLDPKRARSIDRNNPARLVRAIEIAEALGSVPPQRTDERYDARIFGLSLPEEELRARIKSRLKARLRAGMLAEARSLRRSGLSYARMEALGLEYRYMARYLQGALSRAEMEAELLQEIVRYAKRQRTWFKRYTDIHWLSSLQVAGALKEAEAFLTGLAPTAYPRRGALRPHAARRNRRAR